MKIIIPSMRLICFRSRLGGRNLEDAGPFRRGVGGVLLDFVVELGSFCSSGFSSLGACSFESTVFLCLEGLSSDEVSLWNPALRPLGGYYSTSKLLATAENVWVLSSSAVLSPARIDRLVGPRKQSALDDPVMGAA